MSVIRVTDFTRRSQWAGSHLDFAVEGARKIFAHLSSLSERQFICERVELKRLIRSDPANPAKMLVEQIYDAEAGRRGISPVSEGGE